MNDEKLFYNKFEIPLTVNKTEEVFDNIKSVDNKFLDAKLIRDVYMPVHSDDGTSGRPFLYEYSKEDYYLLIKRILEYKPITITYPHGDIAVIEKYINLGVRQFMISFWNDEYYKLKNKYKDLKIYRSIVGNSYNENIDERFDGIVVAYKNLLDIDWLKEASKKTELIAIVNHFCKPSCENLDNHLSKELVNFSNTKTKGYTCPEGRNLFLPRQVLLQINPYITTFKIVDRLAFCFDYEKYIKYYIGKEMLNEGYLGEDVEKIALFYEATIIHKLYPYSNLVDCKCRFECQNCNKKCY